MKVSKGKTQVEGFQVLENECIWMKAGVINFKTCDMAYDCNDCAFDKGMRRAMGVCRNDKTADVAPEWVKHLKKKFRGAERPCRHSLTGRVEAPKICTLNYECYHCAYDQMLEDTDLHHLIHRPQTVTTGGFLMARDYYYHHGHSWARIEHGGWGRIGLDDFAACLFGTFHSLSLPPLGAELKQDQIGWTFQRDSLEAAVLTPLSGTVLAVNRDVQEHPEIINEDPYHAGWLFIVEPDWPKKNLIKLYFGDQSRRWMELEGRHLMGMMGPEYERLAATGGRPVRDIVGTHADLDWNTLVNRFLGTEKR